MDFVRCFAEGFEVGPDDFEEGAEGEAEGEDAYYARGEEEGRGWGGF